MRAILAAALFFAACGPASRNGNGDDDGTGPDAGNGSDPTGTPRECNKMDIVFVVDDSGSMSEEQSNLATNFPMFASLLSQYTTSAGEHLDFRVGITTTGRPEHYQMTIPGFGTLPQDETGPNGKFQGACNGSNPWVASADANGNSVMSCRANVGTGGASIEMPLLMAKRALSDRIADGSNGQFLRPDALLATIMITDEDDQSYAGPSDDYRFDVDMNGVSPIDWQPQDMVNFMNGLKGNPANWAAAVIAGDGACSSSFGNAADATRMKQFIQLTGANGVFSSICDGDLSIGLKKAIDSFQTACGNIIF